MPKQPPSSKPNRKQPHPHPPPKQDPNTPPPSSINLTFSQSFKPPENNKDVYENDIISSLQFNPTGNYLAVGNKGGKITIYKRDESSRTPIYECHISFESHSPEFDYLKSIEIEERITQIKWLLGNGPSSNLLAANDRTIKLWKLGCSNKPVYSNNVTQQLSIPRRLSTSVTPSVTLTRQFNNGHTFHVNTVSLNSDYQTFSSSDDLRINVWHLERTDTSFVIVDRKPENMETLNEVITTSTFHPTSCNILSYSTSRGSTILCDLRTSSHCDTPLRHYRHDPSYHGFFSEVVGSISDAQFSNCGVKLATRNYMNLQIWDTRMESTPLLVIPVQDYLQPHLQSLYESDLIFDKFTCSWSGNDSHVITGSYGDLFCIADPEFGKKTYKSSLFLMSEDYKECKHHVLKPKRVVDWVCGPDDMKIGDMELSKRVLISQWHPKENLVAVCSDDLVIIYNKKRVYC